MHKKFQIGFENAKSFKSGLRIRENGALNPKPQTRSPKQKTLNPKPKTLNPRSLSLKGGGTLSLNFLTLSSRAQGLRFGV